MAFDEDCFLNHPDQGIPHAVDQHPHIPNVYPAHPSKTPVRVVPSHNPNNAFLKHGSPHQDMVPYLPKS